VAGARGLDWLDVETTFYSDSMNDLPLLERVDHPVATNPDARLRTVALERGLAHTRPVHQ
jgi:phosphoserine phosphatase